jgi:Mce-associated membrane protein
VADAATDEPRMRLALLVALALFLVSAGVGSWLGYRAYQSHQAQQQRNLFLQVGRQGALNVTSISYTEPETDVQRVLDSATGTFYDDYQSRSKALIEVVKKMQSKTEATVTEAGLESDEGDHANVLVAMILKTSNVQTPEPQSRAWRMRVTVQKVGDGAKVSNVELLQ